MNNLISPCVSTAEEMVNDIINSDDIPVMRHHLREMVDAFLLTDEDANFRRRIFGTYSNLDHFLAGVQEYSKQKTP